MKKLLLFLVLIAMVASVVAQNRALPSKEQLNQAVLTSFDINEPDIYINPFKNENYFEPTVSPSEHVIGNTVFDSQTNKLLAHRIYHWEDGTIGAVWTMGMEDPSFPDRGTGYNYYNGTEWGPMPTSRVENFRAGWPSYAPWGPTGEVVFSHDFAMGNIYYHTRAVKGTGVWIENVYSYTPGPDGVTHAKVITSGPDNNTIHLLANSFTDYLDQSLAMLYSRSQDGGLTWDIQNVVLDGTGGDYYVSHIRDKFVLAEANGGAIALICGFPWSDLFMMKSTDNGDSWDKTVIWEHPYPFFDWEVTVTDTFFCMDNSAAIALDNQGKAHVVFGINRVLHDSPGTQFWLWPAVDGIAYWNEDMETFSNNLHALAPPGLGYTNSEMIEDYNYIGWMQDINGNGTIDLNDDHFFYRQLGASTMPTISIDEQDRVFVLFSSTTETYEYEFYNFKHIWARAYENNEWGPFIDLTEDINHVFDECIVPVLASTSDENTHYIYHVDNIPGLAQRGHHGYHNTMVIYGACPKTDLLTGISENNYSQLVDINLKVNPNPTSGALHLRYSILEIRDLKLELFSSDGVLVKTLKKGILPKGDHEQTFDMSDLPNGIYFIRLQAGKQIETAKIVLLK